MHAITDLDVTEPLARIAHLRRLTGERISFSAFLIRCVAHSIERYPDLNVYLLGKRRMVRFHDVDIATIVDSMVDGKHVPTTYVIRAAQTKSIAAIQNELKNARNNPSDPMSSGFGMRLFSRLPEWLQRCIWRQITRDPRIRQKLEGTILVSDVTQFTGHRVVTRTVFPSGASVAVMFNSLGRQPWVVGDQVVPRDILRFTSAIDHRVIDGSILVGLKYFARLVETGFELPPVATNVPGDDEIKEYPDEGGPNG